MNDQAQWLSAILGELLRLQRWAGGEHVSADRLYGLANGIESVMREEAERETITEREQTLVEDMLDDVDKGKQSTDAKSIKDRLYSLEVEEWKAQRKSA